MMWAIWKARIALRLPICCAPSCVTTPVVSSRLLETTIVLPMARDSSGSVSRVRQRAGLEEALDDVVFCLLDPGALGTERADVLCVVADVGCADDFKRGVRGLWRRNLQDIAPDMIDRFELEGAGNALWVALFDVERGREPEVRLNVGAPAVEVVELFLVFLGAGEVAVEADDVAVAGLDPDTAEEAAEVLLARDRRYIEDRGGSVAEEVIAHVAEVIVLPVEVVG